MPSLLPAFQGHSRQYLISQQKNTTSWFQRQPKLFRSKKKLRVDWRRVGKRKLAGLFFMIVLIRKSVTLAVFEKVFFLSTKYISSFWGIFRELWPKLRTKKKRPMLRFFRVVMKNALAQCRFPILESLREFSKSSVHCSSTLSSDSSNRLVQLAEQNKCHGRTSSSC